MKDLRYRTEDFKTSELDKYFVSSDSDKAIVQRLCGREAILLIGSRGVGKSFLLRLSEHKLETDFNVQRVVPVYVSFSRLPLLQAAKIVDFRAWMLARICSRIARALANCGVDSPSSELSILRTGSKKPGSAGLLEDLVEQLEMAWRDSPDALATGAVPTVEEVKDVVEDVCSANSIERINLFIDEAAHVFVPDHQRQFFTLMRDLRTPYLSVKAAVYPGTTSYGDSFEPSHDATILSLDRDPTKSEYVEQMRDMAVKQDSGLAALIDKNRIGFQALAIAASGNPRTLLKTLARAPKLTSREVTEVIREFYREGIWSEHSGLSTRYSGHRNLIDWGRDFLENVVAQLSKRNQSASEKSAFFWIHRDAPAAVKESLRLLSYSGLVHESGTSIRATRRELGTRYMVNLGCLLSVETDPVPLSSVLLADLSIKRMIEFGRNHAAFESIARIDVGTIDNQGAQALQNRLNASIDELDLSPFQQQSLRYVGLVTIGSVLQAAEAEIQKAPHVGPVRSRQMMNAAQAAVLEYLSG